MAQQPDKGWSFENPPVFGKITSPHKKKGRFGVFIRRGLGTDFPEMDLIPSPYGHPGERLWVRESWNHSNFPFGPYEENCDVFYRADYFDDPLGADLERSEDGILRKWKPSIHMPRSASRITLEITGVRVERLQDISEADAIAEGSECLITDNCDEQDKLLLDLPIYESGFPYRNGFAQLWESINGDGQWGANPWVWVIEFKRVL